MKESAMKERKTQGLLVIIAALLAANLFQSAPGLPVARAQGAAQAPSVLRAEGFELVDKTGRVAAQLFLGEDGGGNLRLRSGDGMVRVKLGATPDGSGLILFDKEAEPSVWLAANKSGTSATLAEKGKEKKVLKP